MLKATHIQAMHWNTFSSKCSYIKTNTKAEFYFTFYSSFLYILYSGEKKYTKPENTDSQKSVKDQK